MSVPASQRKLSGAQYLENIKEIEKWTLRKMLHLPKKYYRVYDTAVVENAINAFTHAKCANSIYVHDKESVAHRSKELDLAHMYLQALVGQLEVFREIGEGNLLSSAEIEKYSPLIVQTLQMIKGVKDSDKRRIRNK